MRESDKRHYKNQYKEEFALAKSILKDEPGKLEWSKNDYQVFTYKEDGVTLVFYPHKTSAGHYHIRVRNQNSKDTEKARRLMILLDHGAGSNCTFTHKAGGLPTKKGNTCKICGCQIAESEHICGECACENDCDPWT